MDPKVPKTEWDFSERPESPRVRASFGASVVNVAPAILPMSLKEQKVAAEVAAIVEDLGYEAKGG